MAIDLRWGVEEEAHHNQCILEVCLSEVQAYKEEPHPDFVILLGQHYGWVPLPYLIEKEEFEEIYAQISPRDRERIDQ